MKNRRYAEHTKTPVDDSRREVERILRVSGATGFATSWDKNRYTIMFEIHGRRVRFDVSAPDAKDYPTTARWQAEERRRWRALVLILKAKLELVASGDTTFDAEFLANLMTSNGSTIGAMILPSLVQVLESGKMPPMLEAPRPPARGPKP